MTAPPPDGVDCSERLPSWKQCEDACQFSCGTALERFIFDNEPADAVEEADFRSLLQAAIDEQTASLRARVTELEAQHDALRLVPTHVALDLAEIPDRDSPDDQPHMLLVTSEEIAGAVANRINAALARSAP